MKWAAALIALALAVAGPARAGEVSVFAAASLTDALEDVAEARPAEAGAVRFSFASSSTLARQIEAGAPADLFLSADAQWMDYLDTRGLLAPGTRRNLLGNALVVVAPADSPVTELSLDAESLAAALGEKGFLAVGDPDHVPAGIYAKEALESLGLWDGLATRLARADNVRAALVLVARGEAPLGIVYATDAKSSGEVKVVARFPAGSHTPIVYPAALVAGRESAEAAAFLAFLSGAQARAIFAARGFLDPDAGP
ncbi:MAG: molybdate ABC transporter substrate-binding protein [Alphaproteobacteria bacterium]|nr:molybdate ABC transporter substrate-binding protein [Alphaproteobacteria bacterium]